MIGERPNAATCMTNDFRAGESALAATGFGRRSEVLLERFSVEIQLHAEIADFRAIAFGEIDMVMAGSSSENIPAGNFALQDDLAVDPGSFDEDLTRLKMDVAAIF